MRPLLQINNLNVDFVQEGKSSRAVNDISLNIHWGEIVALVGESGSGKSVTSLSVLQLLPTPPAVYSSGQILLSEDGETTIDLLRLNQKDLQKIRGQKVAMIFQEPMTSLNPVLTCGSQVMEALLTHKKITKAEAKAETIRWFEKVKLPHPATLFNSYPHQLSGGQKQRVMIAMAICCNPSLLICDEPTTALDVTVQKTILTLLRELQQELNMGILFITHDLGVVAELAHRVVILYKGSIVEEGSAEQLFQHPTHNYTKALILCRPALHRKGQRLPTVADYLNENKEESTSVQPVKESFVGKEIIQVQNLSVLYPGKSNLFGKPHSFFTAVNDVSFSIHENETLGLVGESGCGKTTLGRTLLRLIEPTKGKIIFRDKDITAVSKKAVKSWRKDVQLIFQDPYSSLNPRLTIGDALTEPLLVSGEKMSTPERRKKVADMLEKVSLSPSLLNRYPHQFSGGQRQRIVIARALILDPAFLVCDESVSALDVSVQAQVLNLLNDLKKELGLTLLFISHDLSVVRYMCDRVMVMRSGSIVEGAPAEDVYLYPKDAYTKTLIEAVPALPVIP